MGQSNKIDSLIARGGGITSSSDCLPFSGYAIVPLLL